MLTVLVPTKNRSTFLLRLLSYYRAQPFNPRLLIVDSSDARHERENRRAIAALGRGLDIEYKLYENEIGFLEKVNDSLNFVETPYTALGADDDFFIPSALDRAVEFLQSNADYVLAHGDHLVVSLASSVAWGDVKNVWRYEQRSIENPDGAGRIFNHFIDYSTTWYSVHRTRQLRENLLAIVEPKVDLLFGELMPSGLSLIHGKAKRLDGLYMVRQQDTAKEYDASDLFDWITGPEWAEQYGRFRDCLAGALAAQDGIEMEEARQKIKEVFWSYLAKHLGRMWQSKYSRTAAAAAAVDESSLRRVARAIPGARRIRDTLRRSEKAKNNALSLPELTRPSSPYHADFMPVYRALMTEVAAADSDAS